MQVLIPIPDASIVPEPAVPIDPAFVAPVIARPMHPMQTRSKYGIYKPRVFIAAHEPSSISDVLQQLQWKDAMANEYLAILRNNVWSLVPFPHDRKAIS